MNTSPTIVDVDPVTVAVGVGVGVAQIVQNRAVIEQAKGVLMAVYDIDADSAFDLLRLSSQHTNIKLRVLAEQLMTKSRSLQGPRRSTFDEVFFTAPERNDDV